MRPPARCLACQLIDAGALADVRHTFLRFGFRRGLRPHRQLQHGRVLMLRQIREQNRFTVREFQCVVMSTRDFPIDLAEDRCLIPTSSGADQLPITTGLENASSVPGSRQTAVVKSSGAAKPRVPVPKSRVINLSPTCAARDVTF